MFPRTAAAAALHLRRGRNQKKKTIKKTSTKKLKLNEAEGNKLLYFCHVEHRPGFKVAYVVHSVTLADLFTSPLSSSDPCVELKRVAYLAGDESLPSCVSCGVFGTKIVFAGGVTPATRIKTPKSSYPKQVYTYETTSSSREMVTMEAKLNGGKFLPTIVELGGELCALTGHKDSGRPTFEAFDAETGAWYPLPEPPFLWRDPSMVRGCAITGTKMFYSSGEGPVYCFDMASGNRDWRLVGSICERGPFPFLNRALVLDIPGDNNKKKKLVFGYDCFPWILGVYVMSLDENHETMTKIGDWNLPMLPEGFGWASIYYILHLGGNKCCLIAPQTCPPEQEYRSPPEAASHKTRGVAVPFQFQVDVAKIDKDAKNCMTLQFLPTRIFQFHTGPSTLPRPEAEGCFII